MRLYDFRFGQRGSTQNGFEIARLNAAKTDFEPVSKPGGAPLAHPFRCTSVCPTPSRQ